MFYAEGSWDAHLDAFAELPDRSIVYHVDQGDIFRVHRALGDKFCLSGGIPNYLLAFGTPDDVRHHCRKVLEGVARDGGYILDASAIIQNDAKVENLRALTGAGREYGVYSRGHASPPSAGAAPPLPDDTTPGPAGSSPVAGRAPGICVPWQEARLQMPPILGDELLCRRIWESVDALGYMYIWWIVMAF